jgi:hypothetical protein
MGKALAKRMLFLSGDGQVRFYLPLHRAELGHNCL